MIYNILVKMAKVLEEENIRYIVIVGQAVIIYGGPRLSRYITLVLDMSLEDKERIKNIIKNIGLEIIANRDFISSVISTYDFNYNIRVDVVMTFSDYEKDAFKRLRRVKLKDNFYINLISLEDLIIHKIMEGLPKNYEEVKKILLNYPQLNKKYILKWLRRFENKESLYRNDYCENFLKILNEIL